MSRIIIAIHGMGNKPPRKQLQSWWKSALREGLKGKGKFLFIKFKLVYWASYVHPFPLDPSCKDKDHPAFLREPYIKGNAEVKAVEDSKIKKRIRKHINKRLDRLLSADDGTGHFDSLTDFIIKHFAKDLDAYYNGGISDDTPAVREYICRQLSDTLHKYRHKKILLIAHSMGTIIAWDVLTRYAPDIKIDTFVTIGSPLGLPNVINHMLADLKEDGSDQTVLKTPENIRGAWKNLADFKDMVAFNADLNDEFLPNSYGVHPEDLSVYNDYKTDRNDNHHKSYGYLRCPEMGRIVSNFLKGKREVD